MTTEALAMFVLDNLHYTANVKYNILLDTLLRLLCYPDIYCL